MRIAATLLAALALTVMALAQDANRPRTVAFTALDLQEAVGAGTGVLTSAGSNLPLRAATTVNVYSYLYVYGNTPGSTVDVSGWGSATQTSAATSFDVYHNETLEVDWSGFRHPRKVSGSSQGDRSVRMSLRSKWIVFPGGVPVTFLDTGGYVPFPDVNGVWSLGPAATGGHVRMEFQRRVDVMASTGPGIYKNVARLTFNRS